MGRVPLPPPPWVLTLDQQIASLERDVRLRRSRMPWRRRRAAAAVARLIVLREHAESGSHIVLHLGPCPRGFNACGLKTPSPPWTAAA